MNSYQLLNSSNTWLVPKYSKEQTNVTTPSMFYKNINESSINLDISSILNILGDRFSMFVIEKIESSGLNLKFYSPIIVKYSLDEDGYYCDFDELDIHSYGRNLQELIESFKEDVVVTWKLYVDCDEGILSSSALRLRKNILKLIQRV